jgi:rhodanese-related sulfurtransferase
MRSLFGWLGVLLLVLLAAKVGQLALRPGPPTSNGLYSLMLKGLLKQSVPFVSVKELKSEPPPVLLDTRAPQEFAVSHLRGARWVGFDQFSLAAVRDLPKDTPVVVYCSVGLRSEKIGERLRQAGYTNVRNLYGGLFEWVNEGNAAVAAGDTPTTRVHPFSPGWGVWLRRGQRAYR